MKTVLVVDDEKSVRDALKMILEYEKYNVISAENGEQAINIFRTTSLDVILLDIKMPGIDGIEVLRQIKKMDQEIPIVMISGHGTVETAIEATRLGAFDYLSKPLDRDRVLITLRNALDQRRLLSEAQRFKQREQILGKSPKILEIINIIQKVGPTESRVLISGESGVGKELVARAIHRASKRAMGPFVEVNCAAIPGELIESELFGHEKGAFTGATAQRIGKFERASGGTIFLDEIGDMSLQAQAKVLRAIEEGTIERVGGNKVIPVDVRIIAATNKNLTDECKKGNFREDLLHRINVIPIYVPPLRERKEDIPILVNAFLEEICARNGFPLKKISDDVMKSLQAIEWRGNVRELHNAVERLVIMSPGSVIEYSDFESVSLPKYSEIENIIYSSRSFQEFKDRAEAVFIKHHLKLNNWNVLKTAESLGMERSHLYMKMKKYGIERETSGKEDK